MDNKPTAYDILGVSIDVSESELRKAFRSQALKVHPDHVRGTSRNCVTVVTDHRILNAK